MLVSLFNTVHVFSNGTNEQLMDNEQINIINGSGDSVVGRP